MKFRIVEFEVEGGSPAVAQGLQQIALAIGRANGEPKTVSRAVNGSGLPGTKKPEREQLALGLNSELEKDSDDEEVISPPAAAHEGAALRRSAPRKRPSLQILEIELSGGPVPLKTFCDSLHPDSDTKKYLVIAEWMKEHRKISGVTAEHIHTAYRHMAWTTPDEPIQPLRDMKRRNGWFNKGAGKGVYEINHVGSNEVLKMRTGG